MGIGAKFNKTKAKPKTTKSKTDSKPKNETSKVEEKGDRASRVLQQHLKDQAASRQFSAIVLFTLSVFSFFVAIIPGSNVWKFMHEFSFGMFGIGAFLWPVLFGYIAALCELDKLGTKVGTKVMQAIILLILICSTIFIFNNKLGDGYFKDIKEIYLSQFKTNGGAVGATIGGLLLRLFGMLPAIIVILLLVFLFLMLTTGTTLERMFKLLFKPVKTIGKQASNAMVHVHDDFVNRKNFNIDVEVDESSEGVIGFYPGVDLTAYSGHSRANFDVPVDLEPSSVQPENGIDNTLPYNNLFEDSIESFTENDIPPVPMTPEKIIEKATMNAGTESVAPDMLKPGEREKVNTYRFPPVNLLKSSEKEKNVNIEEELKNNAERLVNTLKSFNVETTVIGISRGPAVTRYELKPASGVKINKITNLADDIALNLAASGVRIEAPIPNKSAVGIEIPNQNTSTVSMRELIESSAFATAKSKLTVTLGKNITGSVTVTDLAKMPHLLIAGSTGSGKSVCINSLIVSILYKASPDDVKLLMIDPKVVELGIYNGIPHLLVPVVTDPRKASGALSWAVTEMLGRYKIFADNNVRDLTAYNRLCENQADKKPLPQIVIIIDELADLMMAAPKEVEDSICRLAQMARAAGMHLVIATQRPSVDVITGIIKANIPSRIAFAVSSQVDSRTILDSSGAEKLLGRGDMLFYPVGAAKPTRIQGCFVTDHEIEAIIEFVKKSSTVEQCEYDEDVAKEIELRAAPDKKDSASTTPSGNSSDEMFPQAVECVVESGEASTTLLQRKLRLGYARAARIMDELEEKGIVGSPDGAKKRKVLITKQQWLEMNVRTDDD